MHTRQMKHLLTRRLRYSLHGQWLTTFVTVYIRHYKILLVIQAYAYEKIVSKLCMCVESARAFLQGFSNVVFSDRTARLRAVREEGAGGGRSPPPAPSSPSERLRREESKRAATFEKP